MSTIPCPHDFCNSLTLLAFHCTKMMSQSADKDSRSSFRMTKSKIGALTRSNKTPKRRLVVRVLVSDSQKYLVPVGRKHTFNPKHQGIRDSRIDRELLATLLAGTTHAIDDSFCDILSLSFDEEKVCLDSGSEHPLAPRGIHYGETHDLLFCGLGSKLVGLRLQAIAG